MKIIFLIGLVFFSLTSTSQKVAKKKPKPSAEELAIEQERCVFKRNYSDDSLLLKFPFLNVKDIKLISFQENNRDERGIIDYYFHNSYDSNYYKIDSVKIDTDWDEIVILDRKEYIDLANLYFNYAPFELSSLGYKWINLCYRPKNAIIFYDKSGDIASVIEICFECERMRFFPKDLKLGYDCSTKFQLFKKFFAERGIQYGIKEKN